jgi:6-phosphogluconolactonase
MDGVRRRRVLAVAAAGAGGAVLARAGLAGADSGGTAAARQRVFLGTYTSSGGGGIALAGVDPATGRLAVDKWVRAVPDPSWLALTPDKRTLYAVTEATPNGRVTALRPDDVTALGGQPTGAGPAHVLVHPAGKHLFTSLYDGGAVAVHPILADGRVGPASDVRRHLPEAGQRAAHAHQVVVDPSGTWILAVDLGVDAVFVYALDAAKGALSERSRVRLRRGSGPRHLAFHPGGGYAYVAGELDSTVTVCTWRDGTLTPGPVLSTRPTPSTRPNSAAEILVSADGRFVYVSNRGDNTVAVFAVTGGGAGLRLAGAPSCGGNWPRHLAFDPTGTRLYVANERSGDVTWFGLDPATGLPAGKPARVKAPAVVNILFG